MEQEQQDAEKPASKRKAHPLKLALDEGFSAESDGSSEAEGEEPGDVKEEELGDAKEEQQDAKEDGEEARPDLKNGHVDETMQEEEERKEEEKVSQHEETPAAGWSQVFPLICHCLKLQYEIFGFIHDFYISERFEYTAYVHQSKSQFSQLATILRHHVDNPAT